VRDVDELVEAVRGHQLRFYANGEGSLVAEADFGLAPAHYMKARRLNGARNDLCRAYEPLMNREQMRHLDQFARDYRNWFGELPSRIHTKERHKFPVVTNSNIGLH
jgi:hypothetical protein